MSDKKDIEFVDGLIVKAPRDGAPDYVLGSLSIKRAELIAWLSARDGDWVNVEMKRAQSGKCYAAVDNWKPNQSANKGGPKYGEKVAPQRATTADPEDDIPF